MCRKLSVILFAAAILTAVSDRRADAELASCTTISAGAAIETKPGSIHIIGQTAVGYSYAGGVHLQAGAIPCLSMGVVQCIDGDVDGNGKVDGEDIDDYVRVKLTEMGTPKELCAAQIEVEAFVAMLLGN